MLEAAAAVLAVQVDLEDQVVQEELAVKVLTGNRLVMEEHHPAVPSQGGTMRQVSVDTTAGQEIITVTTSTVFVKHTIATMAVAVVSGKLQDTTLTQVTGVPKKG